MASDRRREILEQALHVFAGRGYAQTTIEDVRRASGASIGSLYHHFGSKEALAGALYVEGLRDYHASLLRRVSRARSAEALVKGVVRHYLDWVEANPAWARWLLEMRRAEAVRSVEDEIRALTGESARRLGAVLAPFIARGEIRPLPWDVLAALLVGPAQTLAAHAMLRGGPDGVRGHAAVLADAAWRAVRTPNPEEDVRCRPPTTPRGSVRSKPTRASSSRSSGRAKRVRSSG
jgi:AcrR family transcriptional regulator